MTTITITHLGHSCALIESADADRTTRILLDPGNLSTPLDGIADLDAVLVTHAHPDHLDAEQLRRLGLPGADLPVIGGAGLADLAGPDVALTEIGAGEFTVAGSRVLGVETGHETIYPGIPLPQNLGYLVADRIYAPGDSFAVPGVDVDILLLPIGGPWMKLREAVDFAIAVRPRIVVPVHDAGLAPAHRGLHRSVLTGFAPEGTEIVALDPGDSRRFD